MVQLAIHKYWACSEVPPNSFFESEPCMVLRPKSAALSSVAMQIMTEQVQILQLYTVYLFTRITWPHKLCGVS